MGLRDKLRRLERRSEGETAQARCASCGQERRIREGILLDMAVIEWQMNQDGADELPDDTPADIRWVSEHGERCDPLLLRDKETGESIFGVVWERGARAGSEARGGDVS